MCAITPDISCRCLIQIGLQIPRWRTKWRPCKGMAVSQAFIYYFKWYSLLHFAVCQLLCWAFLFYLTFEAKSKYANRKLISDFTYEATQVAQNDEWSFRNCAASFVKSQRLAFYNFSAAFLFQRFVDVDRCNIIHEATHDVIMFDFDNFVKRAASRMKDGVTCKVRWR